MTRSDVAGPVKVQGLAGGTSTACEFCASKLHARPECNVEKVWKANIEKLRRP